MVRTDCASLDVHVYTCTCTCTCTCIIDLDIVYMAFYTRFCNNVNYVINEGVVQRNLQRIAIFLLYIYNCLDTPGSWHPNQNKFIVKHGITFLHACQHVSLTIKGHIIRHTALKFLIVFQVHRKGLSSLTAWIPKISLGSMIERVLPPTLSSAPPT